MMLYSTPLRNSYLYVFLQDWSNLDVLLVKSRSARLQNLQLLTEIQEFIQFMNNPGMHIDMVLLCTVHTS